MKMKFFYLQNTVAAVAQVVDGADDGQSRTHIGLEAEFHAACQGCFLQSLVVLIVRRGGNLVGGNHADIVFQEILV